MFWFSKKAQQLAGELARVVGGTVHGPGSFCGFPFRVDHAHYGDLKLEVLVSSRRISVWVKNFQASTEVAVAFNRRYSRRDPVVPGVFKRSNVPVYAINYSDETVPEDIRVAESVCRTEGLELDIASLRLGPGEALYVFRSLIILDIGFRPQAFDALEERLGGLTRIRQRLL